MPLLKKKEEKGFKWPELTSLKKCFLLLRVLQVSPIFSLCPPPIISHYAPGFTCLLSVSMDYAYVLINYLVKSLHLKKPEM